MARPAVKKERIEWAAMELFAGKGLARTTVRDIAERAGVAEGALYRHWPGKNDMAWDLYKREIAAFVAMLAPLLAASDDSLERRLTEAVRFIYGYYHDEPVRFAFILLTQHGFPAERLLGEGIDVTAAVAAFIQREMRGGRIAPADPDILTALVMGAVLQPLIMYGYGRITCEPVKMADQVAGRIACLLGCWEQDQ